MENLEEDGFNYIGFKIISLKLTNSKLFGSIEYRFVDKEDKQDKIYTTVIIGPNGTKKSLLLKLIGFILKSINDLKNNSSIAYKDYSIFSSGVFELKYSLNHNIYEFTRSAHIERGAEKFGYSLKINGKAEVDIKDFELPLSIVGNSINITDKLPIFKNEFPIYNYIGVKTSPQAASTKSYLKKIIGFVAGLSNNENFLIGIDNIARKFIGNKSICFTYKTSQFKNFFHGDVKIEVLYQYYNNIEKEYLDSGKTAPFKVGNFKTLEKQGVEVIEKVVNYLNEFNQNFEKNLILKRGQTNPKLKFNLSNENDLKLLKDHNEKINQLYAIGLLTDINIEFEEKNMEDYSITQSSSGEYNLITSFIGLISTVKTDSLILIDEPEISLHPNWQMKYVSFLKEIFNHEIYKTSHIIITSHSHFIVSDLEGESSKVIGVNKFNDKLEIVPFEKGMNTFGWSAEEVLLKIFNTGTSRNFYLDFKIGEILQLMATSNSDNFLIIEKIKELKKLNIKLSKEDPLSEIIQLFYKKIENA